MEQLTDVVRRKVLEHSALPFRLHPFGDARFLDNNYTVFGQMTEGFETLDAIRKGDKMNLVTVEPFKE